MSFVFTSAIRQHRGHMPSLDGIRGLAILMVLCTHLFWSNYATGGPLLRLIGDSLRYGFFGVDLFFVLSGFLITGILVDSLDDPGYFKNFYSRRALRIFPLYYGVLIALFLITPILSLHWRGMGWLFVFYLQTMRPEELSNFSPGSGIGLNHFWSLAVEEQFYLVWPALVFWIKDRRRLLVASLAISTAALLLRLVLIGAGTNELLIHMTTVTRADSLLLGGVLALLYRSSVWQKILQLAPFGFAVAALTVVGSIRFFDREFFPAPPYTTTMKLWVEGGRYTVLAFGGACLIAWSLRAGSVCERFFEGRVLRFFGKYSYGIYILHVLLLPILLARQRAAIEHLTHSKLLGVAGAGLSTLGLSVAAAVVSFNFYEKPFLRLKRYFAYQPERKTARTPRLVGRRIAADLVSSKDRERVASLR